MAKKITTSRLSAFFGAYFLLFILIPIAINFTNTPVQAASEEVPAPPATMEVEQTPPTVQSIAPKNKTTPSYKDGAEEFSVQAILSPYKSAVISAPIDGVLKELPFENGDRFKKNDVLAQFECKQESAKVEEIQARLRVSNRQLEAYKRLKKLDAVADIELVSVRESNIQERALLKQAQARQGLCSVFAPFDGRVNEKMANNFEAIKSGRILMEISSMEPLKADFLIPSVWLQWINIGEPVEVYITESDKTYPAKIIRIHGQVDPVTQTVHAVAKLDAYQEELLPGMSGLASVYKKAKHYNTVGFLGLDLGE